MPCASVSPQSCRLGGAGAPLEGRSRMGQRHRSGRDGSHPGKVAGGHPWGQRGHGTPRTSHRPQPQPRGRWRVPEAGTVPSPGAVPGCPGSAPALRGFTGGKFHQTANFPLGKPGLSPHPHPAACAGRDTGIEGSSPTTPRGHSRGGPGTGGQRGHRQPERWHPSPHGVSCQGPGWGVVGWGLTKPPRRRNEEGGAGSWLRPLDLPVLQRLRVAAGQQPPLQQNIYPSGTVPWTGLPPAQPRAAKHGKARLCAAKLGSARKSVANPSSSWQSPALHGKSWLCMVNSSSAWQSVAKPSSAWQSITNPGSAWRSVAKPISPWQSPALHGKASQILALHGKSRLCTTKHHKSWLCTAKRGKAQLPMAKPGSARHSLALWHSTAQRGIAHPGWGQPRDRDQQSLHPHGGEAAGGRGEGSLGHPMPGVPMPGSEHRPHPHPGEGPESLWQQVPGLSPAAVPVPPTRKGTV